MKKLIALFVFCSLILSLDSYAQLKVNSSGYVGINQSSPSHNLDCFGTGRFITGWGQLIFDSSGPSGSAILYPNDDWLGNLGKSNRRLNDIYCYTLHYDNLYDWSDESLKENIEPLEGNLNKILRLNGVSYNMKKEFYSIKDPKILSIVMKNQKKDFGFIAQEVKDIIPEIVSLDTTSNLYSVNYVKLIPVLVEAIKEQQIKIEELTSQIETIEESCCNIPDTKSASILTAINNDLETKEAQLYQNIPNPFNRRTTIKCYIPESNLSATLYIFNMQGTTLQQLPIKGKGNQSIQVDDNSLNPGMYLYTLIVDGKEIDTKRMILTQ